jgi:murein DD-endopeptidase MepM/ murein hydrolase activator NlpD
VEAFERTAITVDLPLPVPEPTPEAPAAKFLNQERVQRGDTVAAILSRLGVSDDAAMAFLRADPVGKQIFRQLVPGRSMQAETNEVGDLLSLRYFVGATSVLEVVRGDKGFSARERPVAASPRIYYRSATVRSSLFGATDSAGIPDAIATQIARIFSTDIDFHSDLRKGDTLSVIYEMHYEGTELVAPGRILSAEFVNQGRRYTAVLFPDDEGRDAYYGLDGASRAKSFLRSPIEFSRVSSGFGMRMHPIMGDRRAHVGVDFAAPKGTRVLAAGDGHVLFAGWRNGYGNTLEIKHGGAITTLYAHLSGFASGVRTGARVRQGDAVAFVGATGWATGPHLHYEFKVAGMHQDPMKVALPKATPVAPHLKARFEAEAADADARIAMVRGTSTPRFE